MIALPVAAVGEQILLAEKILAIVGGAVVGALALGFLAQLLFRAFTTEKLSRWPMRVVRILGAVIGGWLVALWVLGGGGSGFGGLGGWGLGSGAGKGDGANAPEIVKKEGDNGKNNGKQDAAQADTLRIEVLGSAALAEQDGRAKRFYRLDSGEGARLLTFREAMDVLKKRQEKQPPLRRIEIVLYKDSPEEHLPVVAMLQMWCSALDLGKMKVDITKKDADAPKE